MSDPGGACLVSYPMCVGSKVGRVCAVGMGSSRVLTGSESILHPGAYALTEGISADKSECCTCGWRYSFEKKQWAAICSHLARHRDKTVFISRIVVEVMLGRLGGVPI